MVEELQEHNISVGVVRSVIWVGREIRLGLEPGDRALERLIPPLETIPMADQLPLKFFLP